MAVNSPLVHVGRPDLDFGNGFYLTHDREQAIDWARTKASRRKDGVAVLNVYRFDEERFLLEGGYNKIVFPEYNQQWLDFVAASRRGQYPWQGYDWIEGGVANDSVITTVDAYVDGVMTVERAIDKLVNEKLKHQVCIRKQVIIDNYLTFVEALNV